MALLEIQINDGKHITVSQGTKGVKGEAGVGVPLGGSIGQVLSKIDGTDYNSQWTTPSNASSLDVLIDLVGSFTYVGKAVPGSVESDSVWQVKRIEDLGNGDVNIRFANSSAGFVEIWDDRTTFNY